MDESYVWIVFDVFVVIYDVNSIFIGFFGLVFDIIRFIILVVIFNFRLGGVFNGKFWGWEGFWLYG